MDVPFALMMQAAGSFIASFLAIWVWSRTREEAWIFIILGTLVSFGVLLIEILSGLGILPRTIPAAGRIPLWLALLQVLPSLLFAFGFAFYLFRNRRY